MSLKILGAHGQVNEPIAHPIFFSTERIYLVLTYMGWGPIELGARGGRPACLPPGPDLSGRA
jgi:hypothetical protein